MENISGKSPASFRWIFFCATIGLVVNAPLCFGQDVQNASHEIAITLATVIAAASAIIAVIGAVIASRSARAVMKSAYAAMMSAQKTYGRRLPPPITSTVNKKIDWVRNLVGAIDTSFGTILTILFSIAVGLGLSLLSSRSAPPTALVPAPKSAVQASTTSLSALPSPTATAAAPASPALVSASPPPTSTASAPGSIVSVSPSPLPTSLTMAPANAAPPPISAAAAPDHSEIARLLVRARDSLSRGDVASARVSLRRAAERDDPQAAFALGGTYDPTELKRIGIPYFRSYADLAKAREWYSRAADLGSADASSRLGELSLRRIWRTEGDDR